MDSDLRRHVLPSRCLRRPRHSPADGRGEAPGERQPSSAPHPGRRPVTRSHLTAASGPAANSSHCPLVGDALWAASAEGRGASRPDRPGRGAGKDREGAPLGSWRAQPDLRPPPGHPTPGPPHGRCRHHGAQTPQAQRRETKPPSQLERTQPLPPCAPLAVTTDALGRGAGGCSILGDILASHGGVRSIFTPRFPPINFQTLTNCDSAFSTRESWGRGVCLLYQKYIWLIRTSFSFLTSKYFKDVLHFCKEKRKKTIHHQGTPPRRGVCVRTRPAVCDSVLWVDTLLCVNVSRRESLRPAGCVLASLAF